MLVLKVNGAEGLVRDPTTGAILTTASAEYRAYKRRQNFIQNQKREIEDLKSTVSEINKLKNDLNELKQTVQAKN